MDLNRSQLIGNVTRDPEFRTTATGQNVCTFGVATNMQWTDQQGQKQQRAEFHNIVAWGKLAEICHQYLGKGRRVFVEGRLQTREWEAQDGAKKNRTEIVAENMIMLDRAPAGQSPVTGHPSTSFGAGQSPAGSTEPVVEPLPQSPMEKGVGDQEIRVEDIPF
ncbi:MAG: single-stranded DNA-binding protein [Candidatus Uhrbacteria bacterium]|nr:single-stranded DNA-binding protein [Candidatus Uhrbacteria bacterium]